MWIVVMFDLPTDTSRARKAYSLFRKRLLQDGYCMMQYSVYIRHCPSHQKRDVHIRRVEKWVPADGEVRVFTLTDKQYETMRVFLGSRRKAPSAAAAQLEFF